MTWDYIAGFIDGEGSIVRRKRSYSIYISQTNQQVLVEICNFIGRGHVYPISKRKAHWKDAWMYIAGANEDTYYILSHVSNRLIVKKEHASNVLSNIEKRSSEIKEQKLVLERRIREAKRLRQLGWSYRKIGKKLNTDWGYVRRLILYSK